MDVEVVSFTDPEAPARFTESLRRTGFAVLVEWSVYPGEVSDAAMRYRSIATELAKTLLGWIEEQRRHQPDHGAPGIRRTGPGTARQ